jgi:hypothetical protein
MRHHGFVVFIVAVGRIRVHGLLTRQDRIIRKLTIVIVAFHIRIVHGVFVQVFVFEKLLDLQAGWSESSGNNLHQPFTTAQETHQETTQAIQWQRCH